MCGKMKSPLDRAVRPGGAVHWCTGWRCTPITVAVQMLCANSAWWLGANLDPSNPSFQPEHLMAYQIVYQPSPRLGLDTFFVRVRRHGFMLYTLIVVISTLYVCFLMKPPGPKSQPKSKGSKKTADSSSESSFENIQLEDVAHPVDRWSKRELYQYLGDHHIYPGVDEPLLHVRATAKKYYQGREK